ncbi:MAG: TetR/AcrR family transcriptional regulator [Gemmatimonadales bacterium]|nr:TetR/AcrR family transcriptional regulator [Gemmatimonadales bacterium]
MSGPADTRTRILDVARELFATQGIESTTMRAIAAGVGTSAPAIYHHFADKDALLRELMVTDLRRLGASFARAMRVPDPVDRIREIGMTYVRFGLDHPQHYRVLFMTPNAKSAALEAEVARDLEATPEMDAYHLVVQAVTAAIEAGRFGPDYQDPERVAQICWGMAHGLVALDIVFSKQTWIEWRDPLISAERSIRAMLRGMQEGAPNR